MKRKLYFSFSILLLHNTLPTLSVSVIKASKHPDFVRGGRFPPSTCLLKGQMDRGPHLRKKKEKKACCNRNVWCVGPRVLFLTSLDSALLLLSTHSLTRPHSALPHPSSPDSNPTLWALCALSLPLLRASPSAGSTRSTSGLIPTVPHCLWLFQTVVTVHYES